MKIGTKLLLSYCLVAVVASTTSWLAINSFQTVGSAFNRVKERAVPLVETLGEIKFAGLRIVSSTMEYGFIKAEVAASKKERDAKDEKVEKDDIENGVRQFDEAYQRYINLVGIASAEEQQVEQNIHASATNLIRISNELLALKDNGVSGETALEKKETFEQAEQEFLATVNAAIENENQTLQSEQNDVRETIAVASKTTRTVSLATLLLAVLAGVYVAKLMARRIRQLVEVASEFGNGNLSARVLSSTAENAKDEFSILAGSFNEMAEKVSATQNFVDNIINSMMSNLVVLNPDHTIKRVNGALLSLTGYQENELLNQPFSLICPSAATTSKGLSDAEHFIASINNKELCYRTKDGHEIQMIQTAALLHTTEQAIDGIVCAAQDITTIKDVENQLVKAKELAEAATRSKSEFLANMSHELRTPLNAVIGYSEMLKEEAEDLALGGFGADLEKIHTAGKHLLNLINDILDMSKIEACKMELYPEEFAIPALINEIASLTHPLIQANQNKLIVACPADLGQMFADPTRIRQILINLLSNACKFTTQGTVTITVARGAEPNAETVSFSIQDTGIGIAPEKLSLLFREFSQVDGSSTRKYGGTGLGLAISKKFCEMMGGSISVVSIPKVGSAFTVKLPLQMSHPPQEAFAPVAQNTVTEPRLLAQESKPNSILVIDDDPSVHRLMNYYLTREGFHVVSALDCEHGLLLARQIAPVAILLDILMPDKDRDGWVALAALKSQPELADIPVILISILEEASKGFALGAADYLLKPVDRNRLLNLLKKFKQTPQTGLALVVEDDPVNRELVCATLQNNGWEAIPADNGISALNCLQKSTPQIILLDLMMPEMNGLELLTILRRTDAWRAIPIIVLTAAELSQQERVELEKHVAKIITKGRFSRELLLSEIQQALPSAIPQKQTKGASHV